MARFHKVRHFEGGFWRNCGVILYFRMTFHIADCEQIQDPNSYQLGFRIACAPRYRSYVVVRSRMTIYASHVVHYL